MLIASTLLKQTIVYRLGTRVEATSTVQNYHSVPVVLLRNSTVGTPEQSSNHGAREFSETYVFHADWDGGSG